MNSTFKVVFNKARGALMVVNEITSSVQVKGTKTVVAAAVSALVAGGAMASTEPGLKDGVFTWDNPTVVSSSANISIRGANAQLTGVPKYQANTIVISNGSFTGADAGFFAFAGSQNVTIKDTKFSGSQDTALFFNGHKHSDPKVTVDATGFAKSTATFDNVTFEKNHATGNEGVAGGALYIYDKVDMSFKNGSFKGNSISCNDKQAYGGAAVVKSGKVVFEDVLFENNVATSKSGIATGGAILVDITTGIKDNGKVTAGDVTFKITKDMTYSGNNVVGGPATGDTYGWYAYTGGGFLFLDRASFGTFDIDEGKTLTLGTDDATGDMDSIASALPNTSKQDPQFSTLTKKGAGTLRLNSSLDKYFGIFNVTEGSVVLNQAWNNRAHTTVTGGLLKANKGITLDSLKASKGDLDPTGELTVTDKGAVETTALTLRNSANSTAYKPAVTITGGSLTVTGNLAVDAGTVSVEGGTLKIGGTINVKTDAKLAVSGGVLDAKSTSIFTDFKTDKMKVNTTIGDVKNFTGGTINISDFTESYTLDDLLAMQKLFSENNAVKVSMTNGKLNSTNATLDKVLDTGSNIAGETVTTTLGATGTVVTVPDGNDATIGSVKVEAPEGSTNAATEIALKKGTLTIAGGLNGETKPLVEGALAEDFKLTVGDSTNAAELVLGFDETSVGTLDKTVSVADKGTLTVKAGSFDIAKVTTVEGANIAVANSSALQLGELSGAGNVSIGNSTSAGKLEVKKLALTGLVFLDPAWVDGSSVSDASALAVTDLTAPVAAQLVAGQNSMISLGATSAAANQAFETLAQMNGLSWSATGTTAGAFVNAPVDLAATGLVYVDGSLTAAPTTTLTAGTVTVNKDGMLVVNQQNIGSASVFTVAGADNATVAFAEGSTLGIVNATEAKVKLAKTVTGTAKVVTDNQFVNGALADGVVTTTVDKQKLAGAVASMGVQQMARRADTVFANTIADRTAQSVAGEGVALWVDVGGERYEADDLDNGAQYKANMFYGAFGADVGVTPDARIGAAIQYGSGDSKSDNYGIKNDIDAVTFGLYGSYNVTDAAKIVGEFGWTHTTNDVTSSERLLTNDFDADILSLGVRGQHEFQVGAVKIVPSVGVRVSRISTDSFNVGGVKVDVDDQTIVQVPLSVAFAANSIDANGWKLNPYAKVSFTPTFGDDEINVRGYDQSALDTLPVQGNFGLSATNGNVTFGAALSAGFGQDGAKNFGGKVGVKYVF